MDKNLISNGYTGKYLYFEHEAAGPEFNSNRVQSVCNFSVRWGAGFLRYDHEPGLRLTCGDNNMYAYIKHRVRHALPLFVTGETIISYIFTPIFEINET